MPTAAEDIGQKKSSGPHNDDDGRYLGDDVEYRPPIRHENPAVEEDDTELDEAVLEYHETKKDPLKLKRHVSHVSPLLIMFFGLLGSNSPALMFLVREVIR